MLPELSKKIAAFIGGVFINPTCPLLAKHLRRDFFALFLRPNLVYFFKYV